MNNTPCLRFLFIHDKEMTAIDLTILVCAAVGAIIGFSKGMIWQIGAILGLIAGFLAAKYLYIYVAEKYVWSFTGSLTAAQVISFVGIWIIVPIIFSIVTSLLSKAVNATQLGCINHLLGSVLGVLQCLLFIGVMINGFDLIDSDNHILEKDKKDNSYFYYPLKSATGSLFPAARELTQDFIRNQINQDAGRTQ